MAEFKIKIPSNSGFYGPPSNKEDTGREKNDKQYNNEYDKPNQTGLNALSCDRAQRKFIVKSPKDFAARGYMLFPEEREGSQRKYSEERLVYEVAAISDSDVDKDEENKNRYYLKTGLYVGYINLETGNGKQSHKIHLDINCGYNETFLQRMLNVMDNIYVDNTSGSMQRSQDMFSNIVGFMFLAGFRAAYAMGIPTEYKLVHEHGYNVKGRIDIKRYINKDMFMGDGLSYSYKRREYVQDIIDVLYLAMKALYDNLQMPDFEKYYRELKLMYSGNKVTQKTLNRVKNHTSLNNPMYSRYKRALTFAELVLRSKDIVRGDGDGSGFAGFLLDISQLWEVYLENLLKRRFGKDYDIFSQEELHLYDGAFYGRQNRPDLVIKTKGGTTVAVLDAKFKTMRFNKDDVDRNDMFQIHSYAGYYNEQNKILGREPLRFCALVYPTKKETPGDEDMKPRPIYGIDGAVTNFSVQTIMAKDKYTFDDILQAENDFLDRIQELLEPKQEAEQNKIKTSPDRGEDIQNNQAAVDNVG